MIIHEIDIHLEPRNQSNPKQSSCSGDRISGTSGTGETINLSQALLVLNCSKLLYSGWVNAFCLHPIGFKVKIWLHRLFSSLNTLLAHWYVKSIVIHVSISIICIHNCVGSHFDPQRHSEWKSSLSLLMWKPWLVRSLVPKQQLLWTIGCFFGAYWTSTSSNFQAIFFLFSILKTNRG